MTGVRSRYIQDEKNQSKEEGIKIGMERGMKKGMKKGIKIGMEIGMKKGIEKGIKKVIKKGEEKGIKISEEELMNKIVVTLLNENEDIDYIQRVTDMPADKIRNIAELESINLKA